MLYDRWQRIASERPRDLALHDLASGQRWTFGELARHHASRAGQVPAVAFPVGQGAGFILSVLAAWADGAAVCPLEPGQPQPPLHQAPRHLVHFKTTSGSAGQARLVAFTGAQLAADADHIVSTMGLRPDWPNLGLISLAHSYGFSNLLLPLLLHGIPLVLADSPLPEALRRVAATLPQSLTLPAVPALWRAWHEAQAIPSNIRLAISAGAPLPLALEREVFATSGLKIHNFYGASECGGIAFDATAVPRSDPACVGTALEGVRLSIHPEGCLEVRSAAVAETYWPEPDPSLDHGCHRTSDLAEVSDGVVFLRGRAGDQMNVAGRKLPPETIERVLLSHPAVKDCLVFGACSPATERSDTVVACVVSDSGVSGETLRQFLLTRLPAWQVPREWRFLDSLAPNRRGKLSRSEWRERLGFAPAP